MSALVWLAVLAALLMAVNRTLATSLPGELWRPAGDLLIVSVAAMVLAASHMSDTPLEKSLGLPIMLRKPDHRMPRLVPVRTKVVVSLAFIAAIAVIQVPWVLQHLGQLGEMTRHAGELWRGVLSSPTTALLVSLRAGINEEILFRLLLGTGVFWVMSHFITVRSRLVWASAAVSGALFCMALHPYNVLAALAGTWLGFVYLEEGLIPAVFLHFLIDVVWMAPVALMQLRWQPM
ncbi:MAG: CPBP family intramembrane glutamic endopeptidase [bacterium]|nr:CPBP family intramembrane glutamic endopeptidase [bacterium]